MAANYMVFQTTVMLFCLVLADSNSELKAIENIFSKCKKQSPDFDRCMKRALNDLRPYFKQGIPEIGVAPFDPHSAKEVNQTGTILGIGYTLILRDVYEHGWTQSKVTNFKTDWANATIIYSQYFPVKFLEGQYEFKSDVFGERSRAGWWNLTLRGYSQTTRVARAQAGLAVRVQIDSIGDMELHITNLLSGRTALVRHADQTHAQGAISGGVAEDSGLTTPIAYRKSILTCFGIQLEYLLDSAINAFWKPGFILVRPLINDLVSSAFTNIWSESFKHFRIQDFIKD